MATDKLDQLKGYKKIPTSVIMKRILRYMKSEMLYLIICILLIGLNVGFTVTFPLIMERATNELSLPNPVLSVIIWLAAGYFALAVISQILVYIQSMILQKIGQKMIYKLRMEVFEHIENMSLDQLNEMPVGSLVTRVANYTAAMSDLFTNVLINLLRNILTIVVVFVVMLVKSPLLTGFISIFVAVIFVISFFFTKVIKKLFSRAHDDLSDVNTFLNENLSGMKTIQIFNQEKRKDVEFMVKNEKYRKDRYKIVLMFAFYRPLVMTLYYVSIITTFFVAIDLKLTPGTVVAFYLYLRDFFEPIQNVADQLNNIQRAITSSEKLFNLLDVEPDVLDKPDAIEINEFKGKIEFRNVWFAYDKDEWILKDVSFVIEPRQTVAFVGATGAGKTTILSLIVRNYEVQKGDIFIDDINIKDIKIKSLRKAIGQMLQDVFLFTGTLKSNITLHDESFSDEEVMSACEYVKADAFINELDKGIESDVIERGENFSQGQRQLISFARTVLHKPQILILDEATANIDTETESLIQESLDKIKNIGTMLVVAHRLSTIQKADQIIVLQKGEVVEKGKHQELLKKHGYYHTLYDLQFKEID